MSSVKSLEEFYEQATEAEKEKLTAEVNVVVSLDGNEVAKKSYPVVAGGSYLVVTGVDDKGNVLSEGNISPNDLAAMLASMYEELPFDLKLVVFGAIANKCFEEESANEND